VELSLGTIGIILLSPTELSSKCPLKWPTNNSVKKNGVCCRILMKNCKKINALSGIADFERYIYILATVKALPQ
jgi:hypothetical protein